MKEDLTEEELNFIQESHELLTNANSKGLEWNFVLWNIISSLETYSTMLDCEDSDPTGCIKNRLISSVHDYYSGKI